MPEARPQDHVAVTFLRERWGSILVVVLLVVFVAQNRNRVSLDFFWININPPLWLVMTILFLLGGAVGYLVARRKKSRATQ